MFVHGTRMNQPLIVHMLEGSHVDATAGFSDPVCLTNYPDSSNSESM